MATAEVLPDAFPPMGAMFEKPYMEFEFQGELHRIDHLVGGHNGVVAQACIASPPEWDEEKQRWVIPIVNNLIDIDLRTQTPVTATFAEGSRLSTMRILSNPRKRYQSTGTLVTSGTDRDLPPTFPVDCEFRMHIRVKVDGRPALYNPKPFRMVANGLEQWPPPVGTRYRNLDEVALYPEYVPLYAQLFSPVVRILPGDEAVLTDVFVA